MTSWVRKAALIVLVFLLALAMMVATFGLQTQNGEAARPAPAFTTVDRNGLGLNLSDFSGKVVVLHITQIENPICLECESSIVGQLKAMRDLAERNDPSIVIVTLNLRKNPSSVPGWQMAEQNYGVNVTWRWVEEPEPFNVGAKYIDYWQVNGAFADPTVLMIGEDGRVSAVSHVYIVSKGVADGVQGADRLASLASTIRSGALGDRMIGTTSQTTLELSSVIGLGIVTSFSPCSLALLFTMMMYIASSGGNSAVSRRKELAGSVSVGIAFTLGMSTVFLLIGLLLGFLGGFLSFSPAFYLLSGVVLVVLGVNSVRPLTRRRNKACGDVPEGGFGMRYLDRLKGRSRILSGFFLGVLFSVGWAPCALSLVFPMLLLIFALGVPALQSGLLLFAFGLAHGLVVVPACALSGEARQRLTGKFTGNSLMVRAGFGAAVVVMGLLFAVRFWGIALW